MLDTSPDPCPLCGSSSFLTLSHIHLSDVWRAYAEQWATSFSDDVIAHYGDGPVALRRCGRCELEWFAPALEGDADFYTQLFTGGVKYETWRWEFDRAAQRIENGARVVEVGSGEGAFLRSVLTRCSSVEALEKNPRAADVLRAAGIKVSEDDIRADALARPARADVVCAFQVLEHVADVRGFLTALAAVVVPGGEILLSVPNRERFRQGLEPNDCPPHHLSRWGPRQFTAVAEVLGMELVLVEYQPPSLSQARASRQRSVRTALRPVTGSRVARFAGRATARVRMSERRHARLAAEGRFASRGEYGHTTFAVLRRA
ncbi:bifunctional 2-polyprenyl-6-hydroxyphenol methylase/3-demethylubiquinol 3-O-methyltransferase UbiG [Streptomyces sp. NBC_01481]|uniref:class I SAM-dependent methyltransferase n=1 Tax=Streptomyces sp. NBC_01481 TaxID=2975869 RepID=UPI0022584BC5|nr:class I SAM-dependent methyltransferase [Streptomyces sp. NBC_01481]MCX4585389.1 class I SAM-dependent methyltransferase [Streptomyces sp. NBC_01481]